MTQDLNAFGSTVGDDGDIGVLGNGIGRIDEFAVDLAGKRGPGEAGADVGGDLGDGNGFGKLTAAAVRKLDTNLTALSFMRSVSGFLTPPGSSKASKCSGLASSRAISAV
jgi:hypothetical protein